VTTPRAAPQDLRRLRLECHRVLEQNWREGLAGDIPYAYTCPSPQRYPWQWYWDSCFAAVAWRRFDPSRSRAELETLLRAARPDGFIGHTLFWEPLHGPRTLFYNRLGRGDRMTATIQPPLLPWAWRIAVGDPRMVPALAGHHEWLAANRDLDGDGLLWIVQPDESGLDASPKFDAVWGRRAHGLPAFPLLVRRNRRLGFDARRVLAAGGPVVCEVLTNVMYALSQLALGRPSLTPMLIERLYDEPRGLFRDLVVPAARRAPPVTWAALAPLALPDLPEPIGRRLIDEHLLDPERFWPAFPPPSVSMHEATFSMKDTCLGLRRYWRGPTWLNAAWLLWLGLARLGYPEADELGRRIAATVLGAGLREYYDPVTGAGMGARDFAWSALALELAEPDGRAAGSYLRIGAGCGRSPDRCRATAG
jgi:hypothetical protein